MNVKRLRNQVSIPVPYGDYPIVVYVYIPGVVEQRHVDAYVNYPSTIIDDTDVVRGLSEALALAADICEEVRECGDTKHAPKLDEARRNMEEVAGEDCPGRRDAEAALTQLEDSESGEEIEKLVQEWLR